MPLVSIAAHTEAHVHDLREMDRNLRARMTRVLDFYGALGVTRTKVAASSFHHTARTSSSGRRYYPDPHVGGYVGEGPNVRTGSYLRTIGPHQVFHFEGGIGVMWDSSDERADWLENGTATMPPLPHFATGLEDIRDGYEAAVAAAAASIG